MRQSMISQVSARDLDPRPSSSAAIRAGGPGVTEFNMSTEESYVHSVHSAENRVDTKKPQDGWRFSTTMSNRPLRFAILRTSDTIRTARQSCLLTKESEIRVDEWTYPPLVRAPSGEKTMSTRKTAEWTQWTCISEVRQ